MKNKTIEHLGEEYSFKDNKEILQEIRTALGEFKSLKCRIQLTEQEQNDLLDYTQKLIDILQ